LRSRSPPDTAAAKGLQKGREKCEGDTLGGDADFALQNAATRHCASHKLKKARKESTPESASITLALLRIKCFSLLAILVLPPKTSVTKQLAFSKAGMRATRAVCSIMRLLDTRSRATPAVFRSRPTKARRRTCGARARPRKFCVNFAALHGQLRESRQKGRQIVEGKPNERDVGQAWLGYQTDRK